MPWFMPVSRNDEILKKVEPLGQELTKWATIRSAEHLASTIIKMQLQCSCFRKIYIMLLNTLVDALRQELRAMEMTRCH